MFHGCGEILPSNTEVTEPTESSSSIIIESNMSTCELSEIPFYERLDLRKNEQVIIMDVRGSHLLLNIFEDYPPDDSNFREVGYNSVSHAVAVFDYKKGEIIELRKLEELDYVTDGVFVENGFAYVIMKLDRSGYSSCKLIIVNGNNVLETDLGKYDSSGYSDPRLAVLKNGNIAFSFYDKDSKEFGVKTIDSGGRLTPQIVFVDDGKTKWLTNTLYSNGIEYIYFSAVDELGTFLIGDIDGIKSKFTLAENERIYDYCFLKDSCCFMTIETIDKNGLSKKECIVRSYSGQTLTRNPKNGIYYRITSNNENFKTMSKRESRICDARFSSLFN
jgi:hypothetical protein